MDVHYLSKKDHPKLIELLNHFNLVTQDIDYNNQLFVSLRQNKCISAIGGLEFHMPYALVRSVAVHPEYQGNGYARIICEALSRQAMSRNVRDLYLLTETAQGFFSKAGFVAVERSVVPDIIKATVQFSTLCPDEAVVMRKQLIL